MKIYEKPSIKRINLTPVERIGACTSGGQTIVTPKFAGGEFNTFSDSVECSVVNPTAS